MSEADAYVALICSLPRSERLFVAKQPPLSRLRLDRRLKALTPEDAEVLSLLENALSWSSYGMDVTDAQAVARCKSTVTKVPHSSLRELFIDRMDMRTAVAALRLRRRGESPPAASFGMGRWHRYIPAHWNEAAFGLDVPLPWLKEADQLLQKEDPIGLERLLLTISYKNLNSYAARHTYDFEAVAIYVLIWNIFDRWAQSSASEAADRFEQLSRQAMAHVDAIEFEGV